MHEPTGGHRRVACGCLSHCLAPGCDVQAFRAACDAAASVRAAGALPVLRCLLQGSAHPHPILDAALRARHGGPDAGAPALLLSHQGGNSPSQSRRHAACFADTSSNALPSAPAACLQRSVESLGLGVPGVCNFVDARTKWLDQAVKQASPGPARNQTGAFPSLLRWPEAASAGLHRPGRATTISTILAVYLYLFAPLFGHSHTTRPGQHAAGRGKRRPGTLPPSRSTLVPLLCRHWTMGYPRWWSSLPATTPEPTASTGQGCRQAGLKPGNNTRDWHHGLLGRFHALPASSACVTCSGVHAVVPCCLPPTSCFPSKGFVGYLPSYPGPTASCSSCRWCRASPYTSSLPRRSHLINSLPGGFEPCSSSRWTCPLPPSANSSWSGQLSSCQLIKECVCICENISFDRS